MKKLLIAGAVSLLATAAFALDKHLGGESEFHGSILLDHGPGAPTGKLGPQHDHDEDTVKNFVEHDHDGQLIEKEPRTANTENAKVVPGHDHDIDVIKNFVEHEHN